MRKRFSDHWRSLTHGARLPSRDTVYDYYLHPDSDKFEPWKTSPHFFTIAYDSSVPMSSVTVPTPETASLMFWMGVCAGFFCTWPKPLLHSLLMCNLGGMLSC